MCGRRRPAGDLTAQKWAQEGVEVDATTWEKVMSAARSLGVDPAGWTL